MKELINKKGLPFLLGIISIVLACLGLLFYCLSAQDKSNMTGTNISLLVVCSLAIAIALTILGLFVKFNLIKIFSFIFFFASFATWLVNQAGYAVNVFMGLDGNSFSAIYILAFVLIIACTGISLASFIIDGKGTKK